MFWNSDLSFYGNTSGGGTSWGGWGTWQPYMTNQAQAQAGAEQAVPYDDLGGQGVVGAMADPYSLNPATFEGFLQKNVSELADYGRLSQLVTPEMRQGYQDWMSSTEAGTSTGAARYLAQLSQAGTLGDLTGQMWSARDAEGAAQQQLYQQMLQAAQPQQQTQAAPSFYNRVIKGQYDY